MSFQYELIEPIMTTPFGVIHRGCNFNQQAEVAVLELFGHYREDGDTLNDIWHTIQPICNLKHDFLVPVIDMDKSRGWIVMEMRGETLDSIVTKSPFPQNVVRTLFRNLLELLEFFESNHLVHGDIRPAMLTLPQHPIGKSLEQLRVCLFPSLGVSLCGEVPLAKRDPKYLAPEMLNHQFGQISFATDLYCLGFTVLELLVGTKFNSFFQRIGQDSNTAWHFWHGNIAEQLPAPRDMIPNLDDDLNRVLVGILRKNVAERPASVKEVLSQLSDTTPEPIPVQLISDHANSGILQNTTEVVITTDVTTSKLPDVLPQTISRQTEKRKMQSPNTNQMKRKPWTKEWCNEQINKPHIFAGVAAAFLIPAIIIGLFLKSLMGGSETVPVPLTTTPQETVVSIGERKIPPDDDGNYLFPLGKNKLTISAEGYESLTLNLEISVQDSSPMIKATAQNGKPFSLEKTIVLKPLPILLTLNTEPQNVSVSSNNKELTPDEDGDYSFLPGKHSLKITAEGYQPFELEIQVPTIRSEPVKALSSSRKKIDLEKTITLKKIENSVPINSVSINSVPLNSVPINSAPLNSVPTNSVPLNSVPLNSDPLVPPPTPPVSELPKPKSELPVGFIAAGTQKNGQGLFQRIKSEKLTDLEFVLVESGSFIFGVEKGEKHWGELSGEKTSISEPFYIAITEINRKQYKQFLDTNSGQPVPVDCDLTQENLPVTGVSHDAAEAFCQWIGGRLPAEKEWEFAARFPDFSVSYPWGNQLISKELTNLFETNNAAPMNVTSFEQGKSPLGILNLIGNVSEWCAESYQVGFGESAADPVFKNTYVIKGSSFTSPIGREVRITSRAPVSGMGAKDVGIRPIVTMNND
jgi:formylglycine-generating enzyme required for sulfatase activity